MPKSAFQRLEELTICIALVSFLCIAPAPVMADANPGRGGAGPGVSDMDYAGAADNLLAGLFDASPKALGRYLDARKKHEIGMAVLNGDYGKAVDLTLQYAKEAAIENTIGKVPVLSQLYAMGQLGKDLGDMSWATYGPGEFNRIYSRYFKRFTRQELSRPPDDFVKAMIAEGSAVVLFGWLDRQTGKTLTRDQKIDLVWNMIRKRRNFELLCAKHNLQQDACSYEALMKLEREAAAAVAAAARRVAQDGKISDQLAKALHEGRDSFDHAYLPGLNWSLRLHDLRPYETLRSRLDRASQHQMANIRRYRENIRKPKSQWAKKFMAVTIRIDNQSGHDLKNLFLVLEARLEENDCLSESAGTVTGMAYTELIDPSRPAGGLAPKGKDIFEKLYKPVDEADISAMRSHLPSWYRSATSPGIDLQSGQSRSLTVILGASNLNKLKYSRLVGKLYQGRQREQLLGMFMRRPLVSPKAPPDWKLKTYACRKQPAAAIAFDHICSLGEPSWGLELPQPKLAMMQSACARKGHGSVDKSKEHLRMSCRDGQIQSWHVRRLPIRVFNRQYILRRQACSAVADQISWKIDVGKARSTTQTMFRIHITNKSGRNLPGFRLNVTCLQNFQALHAVDKRIFEYFLTPPEQKHLPQWADRHRLPKMFRNFCKLRKLDETCDKSPWKSGLGPGETKTYRVVYNGCGGIYGEMSVKSAPVMGAAVFANPGESGAEPAKINNQLAGGKPAEPDSEGVIGSFVRLRADQSAPKSWVRQPARQGR